MGKLKREYYSPFMKWEIITVSIKFENN